MTTLPQDRVRIASVVDPAVAEARLQRSRSVSDLLASAFSRLVPRARPRPVASPTAAVPTA